MAAALFGLLGLAALLASALAWSQLWIGALIWLPLAALHLASAIILRRQEQSARGSVHGDRMPGAGGPPG